MFSLSDYIPAFNATSDLYPVDENIIDVPRIVNSGGHVLYNFRDFVYGNSDNLRWKAFVAVVTILSAVIGYHFTIYFINFDTQNIERQVKSEVEPIALATELPVPLIESQTLKDLREIRMERKIEKYHSKWARTEACKRYDTAMKGLACKKDPILAQQRFEDEKTEFMHAIIEAERCVERLGGVESEIACEMRKRDASLGKLDAGPGAYSTAQ